MRQAKPGMDRRVVFWLKIISSNKSIADEQTEETHFIFQIIHPTKSHKMPKRNEVRNNYLPNQQNKPEINNNREKERGEHNKRRQAEKRPTIAAHSYSVHGDDQLLSAIPGEKERGKKSKQFKEADENWERTQNL